MRHRWVALALVVGALALVAAGCGGDDGGGGGAEGSEDVTGALSMMAIWAGDEQASFQAVIDGFKELYPNVDRQVHVRRRQPRAAALDRGRGRQPARHRRDRTARADGRLRGAGRDPADRRSPRDDRRRVRRVGGRRRRGRRHAVRRHVQGRQQVDHLVQRRVLRGGRRRAARDLGRPRRRSRRRSRPRASRRTRSASTSAGRSRDLFENVYIRTAGVGDVRPADAPRDPVDGPVREGRAHGDGRRSSATRTTWPAAPRSRSRRRCRRRSPRSSRDDPEASMVVIGDFAPGVTETTLEPETGFNVFTFPSVEGSEPAVVGGGDLFVEFKDSPAADAFLEYLTTHGRSRDLGVARRVLVAEQESRHERLPGRDHADDGRRARRGGDLPLRPVRPPAGGVRRHAGPGPVQGLHGLRREPGRHRRGHAADGDRRRPRRSARTRSDR